MKKTFEDKILELEEIVKALESGDASLDESLKNFTRATKLAKECDEELKKAEDNVNKILNKDGNLEDFEVKEDE